VAASTSVLTGVEPGAFWSPFETLTQIARSSRHEEPVIEHVRAWADEYSFE
jgi:di/tripeptidase